MPKKQIKKSGFIITVLLTVFTVTLLFANGEEQSRRRFWGSQTNCGPCHAVGGFDEDGLDPPRMCRQFCVTSYYVFFVEVSNDGGSYTPCSC